MKMRDECRSPQRLIRYTARYFVSCQENINNDVRCLSIGGALYLSQDLPNEFYSKRVCTFDNLEEQHSFCCIYVCASRSQLEQEKCEPSSEHLPLPTRLVLFMFQVAVKADSACGIIVYA